MSHNIDMSNNRANVAFVGSRNDIWHRLGEQMRPGMTKEDWRKAAGLDWSAIMVPAYADLSGPEFSHLDKYRSSIISTLKLVDNVKHCMRSDTGGHLGVATDGYVAHQPAAVLDWFEQYIGQNELFQMDVAGSLKGGKIIWATATYNGNMNVAGDRHVARLLMTTTFDGTGSTINKGTMLRAVCNNMLDAALAADKKGEVRTRHNTRFNPERVGRELAMIAQTFEQYKAMGDAMARTHASNETVNKLFKHCLDIPFDLPASEVSTRKRNQFADLNTAYQRTIAEGTDPNTAWSALNAVTRYVDHDRSTKGGASETEARFLSAQFGTGAAMKERAVSYLMANTSMDNDADLKAILKRPLFADAI